MNLDFRIAIIALVATSFCCLEFFSSDESKNEELKLLEKLIDYIYTMLLECRLIFFICIIRSTTYVAEMANNCMYRNADGLVCENIVTITTFAVCAFAVQFLILLHFISSPKFLKKTYSQILNKLIENPVFTNYADSDVEKFHILVTMEDHRFFIRDIDEHTILAPTTMGYYTRKLGVIKLLSEMIHRKKNIWRGYGTIDMQLIRSIGIEKGYECRIRRKIFELCYSRIIYDSYYRKVGSRPKLFKYWMLKNYVSNVRIKINNSIYAPEGGDVFKRAFKKNFSKMSKEEFFIWCLGLKNFDKIGQNVLSTNESIIKKFDLNVTSIKKILHKFN